VKSKRCNAKPLNGAGKAELSGSNQSIPAQFMTH